MLNKNTFLALFIFLIPLAFPAEGQSLSCHSFLLEPLAMERLTWPEALNLEGLSHDMLLTPSSDFMMRHDPSSYQHSKRLALIAPRDQCQLGSCWLNAALGAFEIVIANKTGEQVRLSDMYLLKKYLEEEGRALLTFTKHSLSSFSIGNNAQTAADLAKKYGLVPEEVFKGNVKFNKSAKSMRRFLTSYRIFLGNLREEKTLSRSQKTEVLKRWLDEIFGVDPDQFVFKSETFNPVDFLNRMLPHTRMQSFERNFGVDYTNLVRRQIDAGIPVVVGFRWAEEFIDYDTGLASVSAFSRSFNSLSLKPTLESKDYHAVVLIDYELKNGKIIKFLALNSSGDQVGDRGYFHIYKDFFDQFFERGDRIVMPQSSSR